MSSVWSWYTKYLLSDGEIVSSHNKSYQKQKKKKKINK